MQTSSKPLIFIGEVLFDYLKCLFGGNYAIRQKETKVSWATGVKYFSAFLACKTIDIPRHSQNAPTHK